MEIPSAVRLVNNLAYKPGWSFEATEHDNRFEGTIKVKINYPARNSSDPDALDVPVDERYPEEIMTYASFPIVVKDCDDTALYCHIADAINDIESHEMREFLRVAPNGWAPFHPHRVDGMNRWAEAHGTSVMADLQFGLA